MDRYNDVCLVLDGVDYDCTTESYGQDHGIFIIWDLPKRMVKNIKIDFRSNDYPDYAQIGDIKIFYYTMTDEEQFIYDVRQVYLPTLPLIESLDEKQLWIKERVFIYHLVSKEIYCSFLSREHAR